MDSSDDDCIFVEEVQVDYVILSLDKVVNEMSTIIHQVAQYLGIPTTTTKRFLNHCEWDRNVLINKYYENQAELIEQSGIIPITPVVRGIPGDSLEIDCQICFNTVNLQELSCFDCYHVYCQDCWRHYINEQVNGEVFIDSIKCIQTDCHFTVADDVILNLISDESTRNRYKQAITKNFVAFNQLMRWCPNSECNNAVRVITNKPIDIHCTCGFLYCFGCGLEFHEPATCTQVKKFEKEVLEDTATSSWKVANTKPCPKCATPIQKNGGCVYMICANPNCKYAFCWMCLDKPHGHHINCRQAVLPEEQQKLEQIRARSQRSKYFEKHVKEYSKPLGRQMLDKVARINGRFPGETYINHAMKVLVQSCSTLKYSLMFAYFLAQDSKSVAFEAKRMNFEQAVTSLHLCLKKEINLRTVIAEKQRVMAICMNCEALRSQLLDHVRQGIEQNSWQYLENL